MVKFLFCHVQSHVMSYMQSNMPVKLQVENLKRPNARIMQSHSLRCQQSICAQGPIAELSVKAKQSVAEKRLFRPWREEPVSRATGATVGTRRWVLQSLFGVKRKPVDDLDFLNSVAKVSDGKLGLEQDGFDVQARSPRWAYGHQHPACDRHTYAAKGLQSPLPTHEHANRKVASLLADVPLVQSSLLTSRHANWL